MCDASGTLNATVEWQRLTGIQSLLVVYSELEASAVGEFVVEIPLLQGQHSMLAAVAYA
jgi:hypothetical protein